MPVAAAAIAARQRCSCGAFSPPIVEPWTCSIALRVQTPNAGAINSELPPSPSLPRDATNQRTGGDLGVPGFSCGLSASMLQWIDWFGQAD